MTAKKKAAPEVEMETVSLILDNGEAVVITYEADGHHNPALFDDIENCMRRGASWLALTHNCTAEYRGTELATVNMARVVGIV